MPMYNGNYVAPVWINNVPPAINDTELLAISRTLQNSQIITGSGAPTQYTSGVAGQRYADMDTTPPTIYKLVTAAEDAVAISNDLYKNGLKDFTAVIDAQRSLLSLEESLVISRGQITGRLIALYKALGGGIGI